MKVIACLLLLLVGQSGFVDRLIISDARPEQFVSEVRLSEQVQEKRSSERAADKIDSETDRKPLRTASAAGFPTIERDSQLFLLLQSPDIRQGMEIVKEQETELQALKEEFDSKLRKLGEDFIEAEPGEQPALVRKAFEQLNAYEAGVKEILQPQWDNLQRSLFRAFLVENGLIAALLNPGVGHKIGVSPEQQELLREDLKRISEEVEKELKELQRRVTLEVLSKLSQKQKDEICAAAGLHDIEEIESDNFLHFFSRLRRAANSSGNGPLLLNQNK